jgi:hypothetical protein
VSSLIFFHKHYLFPRKNNLLIMKFLVKLVLVNPDICLELQPGCSHTVLSDIVLLKMCIHMGYFLVAVLQNFFEWVCVSVMA